jgi:hypothetical protein
MTRNETIAIVLYRLGFKPESSTDIAENLTMGYGELDDYGFWQYQIPNAIYENLEPRSDLVYAEILCEFPKIRK